VTHRHSLRKRVALAFALCIAMLSIAWGFAFYAAIWFTEDRVLVRQLERAAESYPALTTTLSGYDDVADLPESIREWAQTNPDEGIYEFQDEELHVAVLPDAFVVFDVAGIEAASSADWWWLLAITGVVVALGALGFGLGVVVMRRAVAPVAQLAKVVADIDVEHLSPEAHKRIQADRFGDDEVGMLAATIEKTLERISAFVERERFFTGSASHELRTPITVITGALELLEHSELSQADRKAVDRVRRATLDMKATIEMFLCLARETDDGLYDEQFWVMPLVSQAIDQQRHLLGGKAVDVDLDGFANPRVWGHPQAFSIAVNNLVRNAFENTLDGQGPVTIRLEEHELFITNQATSSRGYGLGLGIVQRLCERNGWSFSLNADEARVAAHLSWRPVIGVSAV
jgi:signal transduction histidine kinase